MKHIRGNRDNSIRDDKYSQTVLDLSIFLIYDNLYSIWKQLINISLPSDDVLGTPQSAQELLPLMVRMACMPAGSAGVSLLLDLLISFPWREFRICWSVALIHSSFSCYQNSNNLIHKHNDQFFMFYGLTLKVCLTYPFKENTDSNQIFLVKTCWTSCEFWNY